MITPAEVQHHAARWQVAPEQIQKDHLISHILSAISDSGLECWFYGGTALNRSHIAGGRLSEDIDLMVEEVTMDMAALLHRRLLRTVGETTWDLFSRRRWMYTYRVATNDAAIKVQLVRFDRDGRYWGWEDRSVELRYDCLPGNINMRLPELTAFVAMKFSAYTDRWAPRDLLDLSNLAAMGAITPAAVDRLRHATGRGLALADFERVRRPTFELWETELSRSACRPRVAR